MSIRPTYSTMGQSTPASRAEGAGYYVYRGKQPLEKAELPSSPLPQNVKATSAKQQRMAKYTRLRLEGKSKEEAGAALGISSSTANYYERDFQDRQRRGAAQ